MQRGSIIGIGVKLGWVGRGAGVRNAVAPLNERSLTIVEVMSVIRQPVNEVATTKMERTIFLMYVSQLEFFYSIDKVRR